MSAANELAIESVQFLMGYTGREEEINGKSLPRPWGQPLSESPGLWLGRGLWMSTGHRRSDFIVPALKGRKRLLSVA